MDGLKESLDIIIYKMTFMKLQEIKTCPSSLDMG